MRTMTSARGDDRRVSAIVASLVGLSLALASSRLAAQETEPPPAPSGMSRTLAALASTPLGAFTPVGPVMATSGDDPLLFGFRLHYASRSLPGDRTLASYGLTTKVQIEGGALIAATVGVQRADKDICVGTSCDADRMMTELRYSNNLVTTRPFIKLPFFSENDATGTAALELGAGWANKGLGEKPHWTADVTVPLSLGVGQYIRVVTFATPSLAIAWGTTDRRWSRGQRFLLGGGVTAQEVGRLIGVTGLDLSVGVKRIFSPYGTSLGATISYMRVP